MTTSPKSQHEILIEQLDGLDQQIERKRIQMAVNQRWINGFREGRYKDIRDLEGNIQQRWNADKEEMENMLFVTKQIEKELNQIVKSMHA